MDFSGMTKSGNEAGGGGADEYGLNVRDGIVGQIFVFVAEGEKSLHFLTNPGSVIGSIGPWLEVRTSS